MAKSDEELRREKLELLKMKQGLIEESEIIPESAGVPREESYEKPVGWKRVENFVYLNKWILIPVLIAAAMLIFLAVQIIFAEKPDVKVLILTDVMKSDLSQYSAEIELAVESVCADFDGNGYVHAETNVIDITALDERADQYSRVQSEMFWREMSRREYRLIIIDTDLLEEYDKRSENGLLEAGTRFNGTVLAEASGWTECPDNVKVYLRKVDGKVDTSAETLAEQERAAAVFAAIAGD